jgi:MoaA/NifB/PqqE/SkfB family radical SAM enzyme
VNKNITIRSIRWDITDKCNLSCIHCYTLRRGSPDLDAHVVVSIIQKIMPFGLQEINFSGREPTLHKDFLDIVKWCGEHQLKVNITTNGTAITLRQFDKLLSFPVSMLIFSVDDSTAKIHDSIRGKGTFKKTVQAIKHCVDLSKRDLTKARIGVSFTLQKRNHKNAGKIIDLCTSLGIDLLAINPVSLCGSASKMNRELYLPPGDILHSWDKICKRYKEVNTPFEMYLGTFPMETKLLNARYDLDLPVIHTGCNAGSTLYIDPRGKALPCYMLPAMENVIPKMKQYIDYWDAIGEPCDQMLKHFWPFIEFTRSYSQGNVIECQDCPDISVCRRCPLIALSDPDAIYRCQLARKKLSSIRLSITDKTIPRVKPYITWKIEKNRLLLNVTNGDYLAQRTFELNDHAIRIWRSITGQHSVEYIENYLQSTMKDLSHPVITKYLTDFIEYFWKDGVLDIYG